MIRATKGFCECKDNKAVTCDGLSMEFDGRFWFLYSLILALLILSIPLYAMGVASGWTIAIVFGAVILLGVGLNGLKFIRREKSNDGLSGEVYRASLSGLGLLEGEQVKLQYTCGTIVRSNGRIFLSRGVLAVTNDNIIFSGVGYKLRIPIESVSSTASVQGRNPRFGHLRITIGSGGPIEEHTFSEFRGDSGEISYVQARDNVEKVLSKVREERKKIAQEALSKGTLPPMVFCRFCGLKNKADQSKCSSCGAPLA